MALAARSSELMTVLVVLGVLLVVAASLMFYAEGSASLKILQHPGGDVVEHHHLDHRGLRRRVSGNGAGQSDSRGALPFWG